MGERGLQNCTVIVAAALAVDYTPRPLVTVYQQEPASGLITLASALRDLSRCHKGCRPPDAFWAVAFGLLELS